MFKKAIIRYIIFLTILLIAANSPAALQDKITQILLRKDQKNVKYGILVIEPNSKTKVFGYGESIGLVPASNMKLVTSFAALKYLGWQYEFVTTAAISDNNNNLIITGSGDPLLEIADENGGSCFLPDIVKALKERNITQIQNIIVDSSIFNDDRVCPNWPKEQLNRPYACEVSGINYNANCVKISASQNNGQVILQVEPDTKYLTLINDVQPIGKSESSIGAYRTEKENTIIIGGKCGKPASFNVAIERPQMFFGTLLAENLEKAEIKINGRIVEATAGSEKMQIIAVHKTKISDVIKQCNKNSFHLAAECLFKTIAAKLTNSKDGSWQGGQKAVSDYLLSLGCEPNSFNIDDGGGLSRKNRLSAGIIAQVLCDAYSNSYRPSFKESLAEGGIDGTLRKYFRQNKYKGRIFAKTGDISCVRALSGICVAVSGKEYIFSILTNSANYNTKIAIFDIVKAIIDED